MWLIGFIILVAIGLGIFLFVKSLPIVQTRFWGISLSDTKADIKFKKGPPEHEVEAHWVYSASSSSDTGRYVIKFKGENVHGIYYSGGDRLFGSEIQGIRANDPLSKVAELYGHPTRLCVFDDDLSRRYEYDEYNVFFGFDIDKLSYFGVYNSDLGMWLPCSDDRTSTATKESN